MKAKFLLLALLFTNPSLVALAQTGPSDSSARLVVHLLDYLSKDYGGAVQDGKIISESEYKEQTEFADRAREMSAKITYSASAGAADKASLQPRLEKLCALIAAKASPQAVSDAALEIRADVIRLSGIGITPVHPPDLAQGQKIFTARCTACHGATGHGDGPAAASLNPRPVNFHDEKEMKGVGPLQVFHAVRLGVPGTAMAPVADLSDQDTWNVAYFALSLGGGSEPPSNGGSGGGEIAQVKNKLHQAETAYRAGQPQAAQDLALAAYLEGFEPLEPKLKANDPELVSTVETAMGKAREAIDRRKTADEVSAAIYDADQALDTADATLQKQDMSPYMAFTAAAAILLREGFEAVLVVLAFLGVVRSSGSKKAEQWLHGGWVVAVLCGVIAWFFSGWLIAVSGAQREAMEAVTAFFAAAVLLFVGFWLHQKTEITRWKAFVETRVKAALEEKSLWGLASISFIAVFRETLETVLFLRAIWVDCGAAAKSAMMAGVLVSFAMVIALAWAALNFSKRLPIRQLFSTTSFLMAALAVVLVGKGVHSFQETGTFSITTAPIPFRVELFGVFPTWESWVGQVMVVGVIFLLWLWGRKPAPL